MALIDPTLSSLCEVADRALVQVEMQPLYVSGCLGWFHAAMPTAPGGRAPDVALGVVLCPALGREARWSFRSLRQLADRLAAAGVPTLRFDYPSSGDSADLQGDDPLTAWRDSVHAAVDWLRAHTGLEQVALAGLRLGAMLAAEAASSRDDIAAVALLAPVLSGRAHARELKLAAIGGPGEVQPEDGIELDGTVLPDATLAAMGKIELMRGSRRPAARMLLMGGGPRAIDYARHCQSLGATPIVRPFPGYEQMMKVATSNHVPQAALNEVTEWLADVAAGLAPSGAAIRRAIAVEETVLRQGGCTETPVQFGDRRQLVGILCEPAEGPGSDRAVLITNTGHDPRAGIGRFGAATARRLAAAGVATLRFDFAGLGDSRLPGDADGHPYEVDRFADIVAAIDLLQDRGYRRFGATGVCTGAYHLLHAAVEETRIELLMLINLVTFEWRRGDVLEVAQRALGWSTGRYKELVWQAETWRRLVQGRLDLRHVGMTLGRRLVGRVVRPAARMLGSVGLETSLERPRRLVQGLVQRGTRITVISGFDDPGIAALESNFGHAGRALAAMPGAEVRIERGVDHTLSRRCMQERVIGILVDAVRQDTGASGRVGDDARRVPVAAS